MKAAAYLHFNNNAQDVSETYKAIFCAVVMLNYSYEEGMTDGPVPAGQGVPRRTQNRRPKLYLADTGESLDFSSIKLVSEIRDEAQAHRNVETTSFGPTIAEIPDDFGIMWNIQIC